MIDVHFVPTPNGNKVTIMLEEVGLPYRLIPYNMLEGEHLTPEFRRINPNGRLPAIVDHEPPGGGEPFAVFESGAILLYLSEKAGGALTPADPRGRSLAHQWLMWQMAGLGPMHGQAHHFIRYAPEGQDYGVARYGAEAARLLAVMDARLGEADYLAGEYSVADIAAWPWVRATYAIGLDLEPYPNVRRWVDAVGARPAVQRGVETRNAPNLQSRRPTLTPQQWSNLFGENMHRSFGVTSPPADRDPRR
ncbi:glutathione S-transferase N-terminal domain-containing protein [Phenylobacterium sp. SCN 70-31]|uniref:glutathione S-transferase family protein n=1 Tax=Phenylobacterium sp. SCN 70-31 TaxID=1660129 RepID=UPI00086A33A2|nr:glutathione S-transferase N-terminal domain-containing protein [Phenylobacterium sp. SCN 70-31]ODT88608.1 MAG: thiol:disulfide oxidoreductase [Phenylobacterium sp. SCN 70-31]